ncbi:PHP domain-containing protein, putative [Babesia ovata]|uniref:PHP domain-containing protein, putative n=1 Tax=Babesia ovata TaxID=189622 RepID=A0A2H6KIY8_9APIC|nr:PHP domain-containing protein, putative [Babesia ovata]GBE62941.1 PHP domain-containing protein, putative [Babesia ovata]
MSFISFRYHGTINSSASCILPDLLLQYAEDLLINIVYASSGGFVSSRLSKLTSQPLSHPLGRVDLRRDGGVLGGADLCFVGEPFELCGGLSGPVGELVEDEIDGGFQVAFIVLISVVTKQFRIISNIRVYARNINARKLRIKLLGKCVAKALNIFQMLSGLSRTAVNKYQPTCSIYVSFNKF